MGRLTMEQLEALSEFKVTYEQLKAYYEGNVVSKSYTADSSANNSTKQLLEPKKRG